MEKSYNLNAFRHRLILAYFSFIYKIVNTDNAPSKLKELLIKTPKTCNYNLRNSKLFFDQPLILNNHFGENTFDYFFSKFINNFFIDDFTLSPIFFNNPKFNNINLIVPKFIKLFSKFDY